VLFDFIADLGFSPGIKYISNYGTVFNFTIFVLALAGFNNYREINRDI